MEEIKEAMKSASDLHRQKTSAEERIDLFSSKVSGRKLQATEKEEFKEIKEAMDAAKNLHRQKLASEERAKIVSNKVVGRTLQDLENDPDPLAMGQEVRVASNRSEVLL